jgi:hypothetical protein
MFLKLNLLKKKKKKKEKDKDKEKEKKKDGFKPINKFYSDNSIQKIEVSFVSSSGSSSTHSNPNTTTNSNGNSNSTINNSNSSLNSSDSDKLENKFCQDCNVDMILNKCYGNICDNCKKILCIDCWKLCLCCYSNLCENCSTKHDGFISLI